MKNSLKLLLFSMFLCVMSCKNAQLEKNISMYTQTWDQIINDGNIDLINNTNFVEDIILVSSPENIVGIENVKAYYQNFLTGFSDIEFTTVDAFGQDDKIVKHWSFKGKHTGEFFGMPPTGKPVNIEGVTLVKMQNGKILQEHDFMDNMAFLQQLGVVSAYENTSLVNNLYTAFGEGDIPKVLAGLDAEVIWNEAEGNAYADGNPYIGPDAVLEGVFARVGEEHEYFKLSDIEIHDMYNNQVLATLRYDAKLKKTGKTYNAQAAHLWTIENGKVVAFQQYIDTKKLDDVSK
ncbi:ester cyclase [Flavisericum labens]|uniref:ester cyclase n=1 Tax=Flavisericum labens TaxID=3377112 RepID=UPI00387AD411